jgi:hypothetical protein
MKVTPTMESIRECTTMLEQFTVTSGRSRRLFLTRRLAGLNSEI